MKHIYIGSLSAYARLILVLTTSAMLVGCVVPGRPIPEARLSSIKTIGVISVAAFRLNVIDTSPLSIPSYKGSIEVSDMALDELMVQRIAGLLSPTLEIKPVTYKPAEFLAGYKPDTSLFHDCPNVIPDIGEITKQLPNDGAVDAYVVIYPRCVSLVHFDGFVLQTESLPFKDTIYVMLGSYTLDIVDARTHEILGTKPLFIMANTNKSAWPEGMRFTDDQRPRFKKDFETAMDYGIGPVLKSVGLIR